MITFREYDAARYEEGSVYEIIDGVLIVSPNPAPWHDHWVTWVYERLEAYSKKHSERINRVSQACEIYIPSRIGPTRPQPDVAAYRNYPKAPPKRWDDVCPLVVVEVVSARRALKDVQRNRELYWMASGIGEYWIVNPLDAWERPALIALCRSPDAVDWRETRISYGQTYRTPTLPGFSLNLKRQVR
ncbi:MAG: hypothetical protein CHACPFDD_02379 [Phycisphaerae bacterium]|nr:hypothetical protein [Phycisphaerae bacterium]